MADSVVSLGLDLSAFDATLKQGFDGLGKGAQRALAQAKAAAAQAARESAAALRQQLTLQAQAARDQSRAQADQLRAEQALTRETERRAAEQARAARQLSGLAAGRTEVERLTHAYREQIAEIQRLVEVTGDQQAGAKAVAAATAQYQAQIKQQTTEIKKTTGTSYAFGQQVQSLRKNMLDLAQGIGAGQSPLMALQQQLPAIAEAAVQSGDAVGSLRAAFAPLLTVVSAIAAPLAIAAVAAAALGTAYVVVANQTEAASTSTAGLIQQVEASRAALDRARASAQAQASALRSLAEGAATAEEDLAVLVGTADRHEVAMRREIAALEDRTRETALAATQQLAATRVALQNEKTLYANVNASVTARAEASRRIKVLEGEVRAQETVVETARTDLERQREAIRLGAEYRRELEASNDALDKRDKATRRATQSTIADSQAVKTSTDRFAEFADQVADVVRLFDEASFLTLPADLVSRQTLDTLRDLQTQIDRLVPPRTLTQLQQIELLLSDVGRQIPTEQTAEWTARLLQARDAAAAVDVSAADAGIADAVAQLDELADSLRVGDDLLRGAVGGARSLAAGLSAAAGIDFEAFTSLQGFTTFLIEIAGQAVEAQRAAAAGLAEARADLSAALATGDAEAIAAARAALGEARTALEDARPYAFVQDLLTGAADFVGAIVAQLPAVVDGLVAALPDLIDALVDAIPQIVVALVEAIPIVASELAIALAIELPIAMVKALPDIIKALGNGIVEAWRRSGTAIRDLLRDVFREITTGGRADTRTFGDTPGPVRVGPLGARVSPGDYVVAARSREGLAAQTGGGGAAGSVTVLLDVRDGPVALGLSRAVTREIGRSGLGRDSTGRRSPYARR